MNITQLASKMTKTEGLKVQVSVGNMREILAILSDIIWEEYRTTGNATISKLIFSNGQRR